MIYFIVSSNRQYVKIGYSKDPERRFKELQYMCPLKLELKYVMEGTITSEKSLHLYYEKYKIPFTNEWFFLQKELKLTLNHWYKQEVKPKSLVDFIYKGNKAKKAKQIFKR